MKNPQAPLPPGFRFHPTDEELILHYLRKKLASTPLPVSIIAEVDIYKFDPWELPGLCLIHPLFYQTHDLVYVLLMLYLFMCRQSCVR